MKTLLVMKLIFLLMLSCYVVVEKDPFSVPFICSVSSSAHVDLLMQIHGSKRTISNSATYTPLSFTKYLNSPDEYGITITANHSVKNNNNLPVNYRYQWRISGGIELPVGKDQNRDKEYHQNFQGI